LDKEDKAVIFDLDGTLSDTQKMHAVVESALLAKHNVYISPSEITRRYAGVITREFFQEVLSQQRQPYDLDALLREKWKQMAIMAKQQRIKAMPGAVVLVRGLSKANIRLAVASASNLSYVMTVLQVLALDLFFQAVVSGDMVQKGKPDPESFLLAAEMLGVRPAKCVVVEDGRSGMTAALAAGMKCVGVVERLDEDYPARILVRSLENIKPEFFQALLD
jgi:beta-phosphoglucomutase family hydrolase